MTTTEKDVLVRYQASLFTALAGIMVAKDLCTRQEIAGALELIRDVERSDPVKSLLDITISALGQAPPAKASATTSTPLPFKLIVGGLE